MYRSPGIFLPAEDLGRTSSHEGCATSHWLKWGPLPPNELGRIAQHVRKGEGGRGQGEGSWQFLFLYIKVSRYAGRPLEPHLPH